MRESAGELGSLSGSVESLPCSSVERASIFSESASSSSMAVCNDFRKCPIVGSNGVREIARSRDTRLQRAQPYVRNVMLFVRRAQK